MSAPSAQQSFPMPPGLFPPGLSLPSREFMPPPGLFPANDEGSNEEGHYAALVPLEETSLGNVELLQYSLLLMNLQEQDLPLYSVENVGLESPAKLVTSPSKPPGFFQPAGDAPKHPPHALKPAGPPGVFRTYSDASTEASPEASDPEDSSQETPPTNTVTEASSQATPGTPSWRHQATGKELRIEALNMAQNKPLRVQWPVDAKKLSCRDKQIVSPPFEIEPGCVFKLMLKPKAFGEKKGQASFHKARGWGAVELKCVDSAAPPHLRFRISVGDSPPRSVVSHDFSENSVATLNSGEEAFNFRSALVGDPAVFWISLEAQPNAMRRAEQ